MQNRFRELEFYLKWSLVLLSVIGMKPSESENENMSNSRNLFCMVQFGFWSFVFRIPPWRSICLVVHLHSAIIHLYSPSFKSVREVDAPSSKIGPLFRLKMIILVQHPSPSRRWARPWTVGASIFLDGFVEAYFKVCSKHLSHQYVVLKAMIIRF